MRFNLPNPACDIDAKAWQRWHREWALRLLDAPPSEFKDYLATIACRDATVEPQPYSSPPGWFAARVRIICALIYGGSPDDFRYSRFCWMDHCGIVRFALPDGEQVRCFVSEPYQSYPVSQQFIRPAHYLASLACCDLVVDRIAWWEPCCVRLMFLPAKVTIGGNKIWSHRLTLAQWKKTLPEMIREPCSKDYGGRSDAYFDAWDRREEALKQIQHWLRGHQCGVLPSLDEFRRFARAEEV